jgi:hypothetical protein
MHRIVPALLLIALVACKKETTSVNFHEDYFPITQGHFVTYSVREVYIDAQSAIYDTTEYFLKAVVGDPITDNEGRVAHRYNRYVSQSANGPWTLQDIWTTLLDGNRVELIEENQRTIKLVLSPGKYKQWDANAYNMDPELDCYYRDLHLPAAINGFAFDSTVTVEQASDTNNVVLFRRKYEQYAKGVGMYYKHFKDYIITNKDTLHPKKGNEIIMRLVDYGTE